GDSLADLARDEIRAAARRVGNDEAYRTVGVARLRRYLGRRQEHHDRAERHASDHVSRCRHRIPSHVWFVSGGQGLRAPYHAPPHRNGAILRGPHHYGPRLVDTPRGKNILWS